jgi:hypothetical protein
MQCVIPRTISKQEARDRRERRDAREHGCSSCRRRRPPARGRGAPRRGQAPPRRPACARPPRSSVSGAAAPWAWGSSWCGRFGARARAACAGGARRAARGAQRAAGAVRPRRSCGAWGEWGCCQRPPGRRGAAKGAGERRGVFGSKWIAGVWGVQTVEENAGLTLVATSPATPVGVALRGGSAARAVRPARAAHVATPRTRRSLGLQYRDTRGACTKHNTGVWATGLGFGALDWVSWGGRDAGAPRAPSRCAELGCCRGPGGGRPRGLAHPYQPSLADRQKRLGSVPGRRAAARRAFQRARRRPRLRPPSVWPALPVLTARPAAAANSSGVTACSGCARYLRCPGGSPRCSPAARA